MDKLQVSEKIVADILIKLFENGLEGYEVNGVESITDQNVSRSFLMNVMLWLQREELVAFEQVEISSSDGRASIFTNCMLTSRGFLLMGHDFHSGSDETIGSVAKKVSDGNNNYANMGDLLGGLLGGFTKSISS